MLTEKKILVTGSTGLIGQSLVLELLGRSDYKLRLAVRDAREARAKFSKLDRTNKIELVQCDFRKAGDMDFANLSADCDSIVHCAGLVHQAEAPYQEYKLLNVKTTEQLLHAAQKNMVGTFVFLSSSAVYGEGPFSTLDENAPLIGKSPYAVSKIKCEEIIGKVKGIKRIINIRPAMVFGEGDRGNLIKLIQAIDKKKYVQIGEGRTLKSLIYARDLARAIMSCLDKLTDGTHVLNAANPEAVSMKNLSTEIWSALGHQDKLPSVPEALLFAAVKMTDKFIPGRVPVTHEQIKKLTTETTLDVYKLCTMTGFSPSYTLGAALRSEIKWAKDKALI